MDGDCATENVGFRLGGKGFKRLSLQVSWFSVYVPVEECRVLALLGGVKLVTYRWGTQPPQFRGTNLPL